MGNCCQTAQISIKYKNDLSFSEQNFETCGCCSYVMICCCAPCSITSCECSKPDRCFCIDCRK